MLNENYLKACLHYKRTISKNTYNNKTKRTEKEHKEKIFVLKITTYNQ